MEVYREARMPPGDIQNLFVCNLQTTPGGATAANAHIHEHFEALYCERGEYQLRINGVDYKLRKGDMALIDPMETHFSRGLSPDGNQYIVLRFVPEVLYAAEQPMYEQQYIMPYLLFSDTHQKLFVAEDTREWGLGECMRDILAEYTSKSYGYELAVRANIERMFLMVLRRWHAQGGALDLDAETLIKLKRALSFVEANYAQEITMADAARACGMSYTAFSRFFSRNAKCGFSDYLASARLKKASFMLCSTDKSVTEIALSSGFSSTSYFVKRYREANGMTPGQYRKRFIK